MSDLPRLEPSGLSPWDLVVHGHSVQTLPDLLAWLGLAESPLAQQRAAVSAFLGMNRREWPVNLEEAARDFVNEQTIP